MAATPWNPTRFQRFEKAVGTSTQPARIVTDAGPAFLKAINNRIGPHALARELVGTRLARWFGLDTFTMAIMTLDGTDEILIEDGKLAAPGPSLVTRTVVDGISWGGDAEELALLDNPEHISRLVVFDTWTRNADRYPPAGMKRGPHRDNVFFSPEGAGPGRFRLVAMDHTECFGGTRHDLNVSLANIDNIHDDEIYGLFPEFRKLIVSREVRAAAARLREIDQGVVGAILAELPTEWKVPVAVRQALGRLIVERAAYLADENRVVDRLCSECELLPMG